LPPERDPRPRRGPLKSVRILGSRVDRLEKVEALALIRQFVIARRPSQIVTTNTLMLLAAETDADLRGIINSAPLSVPESSGLRWAGRLMGKPFPEIIPGIDLMLELCGRFDGEPIYFLGSAPGVARAAADELLKRVPSLNIVGTHDGYFKPEDEADVLEHIRASAPTFLFVGLGMPAQEKWIARHFQSLNVPVVIGIGGSFDVISGKLARAPRWMQSAGIEWAYRLYQEPWRWRRIVQLPVFLMKVLKQRVAQSGQRSAISV